MSTAMTVLRRQTANMKQQIALLACFILVGNVALANVDCARAPFGESVAQYGRDEFHLGMLSMAHDNNDSSVPRSTLQKVDGEMSAACLAKFYGKNLPRYAKLGLTPLRLATESVGSIAADALNWSRPDHGSHGSAPPPSSGTDVAASNNLPAASGKFRRPPSLVHVHYVMVTSNFPACPRRVDLKRILSAALINAATWPQAEAAGKEHGCIELHAGERVSRIRTDGWSGVTEVQPAGHTRTYWTDSMVVK